MFMTMKNHKLIIWLLIVLLPACREQEANTPTGTTITPTTVQTQGRPTETNLAFSTLAQGDWGDNDHFYNSEEPALRIIIKPEDINLIANWISQESVEQLQKVDYANNLAIAVFQGLKGILGYDVQIERIGNRDDVVNVYAYFREPEPGAEEIHEAISPYKIIWMQRFEKLDEKTIFNLIVNMTVIDSYPSNMATPTPTQPAYPYPPSLRTPDLVPPYP